MQNLNPVDYSPICVRRKTHLRFATNPAVMIIALAVPLFFISCGRGEKKQSELLSEGTKRGEVFDVFLTREELLKDANNASQAFDEVDHDFQELLKGFEALKFAKEVELTAFDLALKADKRYELSLMFKVHRPMSENYQIHVHAHVADEHLNELSEKRKTTGFENWQFTPQPPTSEWEPGNYYVVKRNVWAKQIPYRVKVKVAVKKRGQWEQLGKDALVGWIMAAVRDGNPPDTATEAVNSDDKLTTGGGASSVDG